MSDLSHHVERVGGIDCHVIELPPILVPEVVEEFDKLVRTLLAQSGSRIRVDCRQAEYLPGDMFALLLSTQIHARRSGIGVSFRMNPRVRQQLRTAGMSIPEDDGEDGLAGLPSPRPSPPTPRPGRYSRPRPSDVDEPST